MTSAVLTTIDPATGEVIAEVPDASAADVDAGRLGLDDVGLGRGVLGGAGDAGVHAHCLLRLDLDVGLFHLRRRRGQVASQREP